MNPVRIRNVTRILIFYFAHFFCIAWTVWITEDAENAEVNSLNHRRCWKRWKHWSEMSESLKARKTLKTLKGFLICQCGIHRISVFCLRFRMSFLSVSLGLSESLKVRKTLKVLRYTFHQFYVLVSMSEVAVLAPTYVVWFYVGSCYACSDLRVSFRVLQARTDGHINNL